mgnify:CR=1 FL=1
MAEEKKHQNQLTGAQKSAILMMLLGEDGAAEILKNLSPKEVQSLGKEMYSVKNVGQETVNAVLNEFLDIVKEHTGLGFGTVSPAQEARAAPDLDLSPGGIKR